MTRTGLTLERKDDLPAASDTVGFEGFDPILSEVAGRMSIQVGAASLQKDHPYAAEAAKRIASQTATP